eukprot:1557269-Prorocentrum_lima.AAC.1
MERTTRGLWRMLRRHGLPLWQLNSENKHRRPDNNNQHKSVGVWRCLSQDWWTRNGNKELDRENPEHHQDHSHPMLKLPKTIDSLER